MITPDVTVNHSDLNRLKNLLSFVATHTRRNMGSLVKQSALTAIQSAAKATKPGDKAKIKGLPNKYRLRLIITMRSMHASGSYVYAFAKGGKFSSPYYISDESLLRRGLRRVTKAFKAWSKKLNRWEPIPYIGSANKYDANAKGGKIPGYAAAKSGWLKALGKFGKPEDTSNVRKEVSKVRMKLSGSNPFAIITNLVKYAAKIAPDSAIIGITKATNRLKKVLLPKLTQELQDKWRNS